MGRRKIFLSSTPLTQTKYLLRSNYNGVSNTPSESAVSVGTRGTLANLTLQLISSLLSYAVKDCLTIHFRKLALINLWSKLKTPSQRRPVIYMTPFVLNWIAKVVYRRVLKKQGANEFDFKTKTGEWSSKTLSLTFIDQIVTLSLLNQGLTIFLRCIFRS